MNEGPGGSTEEAGKRLSDASSSRRKTYLAGLGAGYLYIVVAGLVQLVLVPVLLGNMGRERYGVWLTLYAMGYWASLGTTWVSPGVVKRVGWCFANADERGAWKIARSVSAGYLVAGVAVLVVAVVLSSLSHLSFLGGAVTDELRWALWLAAVWIAAVIQSQVWVNVLTAAKRLDAVHLVQTLVLLLSGTVGATFVASGGGLRALTASYAGAAFLGLVLLRILASRYLQRERNARVDPALLKDLVKLSAPFALAGAGLALLSSDLLLLAFLEGPAVVAVYGVAFMILTALTQIIWRIADAGQPYIVEFEAKGDVDGLRSLHRRVVQVSTLLGGTAAVLFFFLGEPFMTVWLGSGRSVDAGTVRGLAVYLALQAFLHANLIFPFSTARMTVIGKLQLVEGIAKCLLAVPLVAFVGTLGVPLASILAVASVTLWYVPIVTMRWLEIDAPRFLVATGTVTAPTIAITAVAAGAATAVLQPDSYPSLIATGAISLAAFAVGVGVTAWRARSVGDLPLTRWS